MVLMHPNAVIPINTMHHSCMFLTYKIHQNASRTFLHLPNPENNGMVYIVCIYIYIYTHLHILLYTVMPKFQDLILQGLVLDRFVHVAPHVFRRPFAVFSMAWWQMLGISLASGRPILQKVKLFSDVTLVYKAMN